MSCATLLVEPISAQNCVDCVKITNPKIIDFYRSNPHISFETVNLHLLEILQKVWPVQDGVIQKEHIETAIFRPEEKHHIDELNQFSNKLREAVHQQIQHISSKYVSAKTDYVREFRSIFSSADARTQIPENNARFIERIKHALSGLRATAISDKSQAMLRQFQKIMTSNSDAVFKDGSAIVYNNATQEKEYVENFESNAAHMMQAITQLLTDCLADKEQRIEAQLAALKRREDANSTTAAYYKLIYECNDVLHQLQLNDENVHAFDLALSKTFPTASIINDSSADENAPQTYILTRDDKPTICIESHELNDRNVGILEIKHFLTERTTHGIMVSQHTGITAKPNYHVEIHNNFIIVYLHKLEYSGEKLQIAVDMIDALSSKMGDFCMAFEHRYSIPKEVLDDINREYQQFIIQKEAIVGILKDQHKRLLGQMDEMRFNSLDKYLATRYSSCVKQGYTCDLCNGFTVGTLKGLAAHKRGCARKLGVKNKADPDTHIVKKTAAAGSL